MMNEITLLRPDDWHLHLRDGEMLAAVCGHSSHFGRAIIMAVMFIGRVGPLTLGFLLATRRTPRVQYPTGTIHIG